MGRNSDTDFLLNMRIVLVRIFIGVLQVKATSAFRFQMSEPVDAAAGCLRFEFVFDEIKVFAKGLDEL